MEQATAKGVTGEQLLYTARVRTTGGREGGTAHAEDGRLDVKFSVPGGPGTGTNPEEVFAAGWSACFLSAIRHAAGREKVRFPLESTIDAEVDLNTVNNGYFLRGRLNVHLPGLDRETAQKLVDQAEQLCPYSKAIRGNVETAINLV
jgi:lipoyl-dependent peroxiredoxin